MTATAEPPLPRLELPDHPPLTRGEGVELLGDIHGCGYRNGAALVRRGDGQMVQVGPLMYGLLEEIDGQRGTLELADALTERCGRRVEEEHVVRLSAKLAQQGLLGGTEHRAPPRRNPLLALRFKVLVTNPKWTQRLTAPFAFLFRPWIMWPVLAAFVAVLWFVLFHKGLASATAQAFDRPELLLLVFVLAVASAGFHELGHAAACRYGGARPGGMGMGLYLVWPAFYTDVTDTYRLPKRDRLRVDLGGLYFNAVIAVATLLVWLAVRADALLLLVGLQVLQMVKQLSPVIRADGYHILSDATGVPDLYSHMGPTMRRLLPGHRREPSVLTGRARLLVTVWVLIIVPVLLSLMLGAVLLLPHIAASAWSSGRDIVLAIPHQAKHGQVLDVLASIVRLLALALPVIGSLLITQKVVRMVVAKARGWSAGHPFRRAVAVAAGVAACAGIAWAWYPSGQYQPVRADQNGTVGGLLTLVSDPVSVARPVNMPATAQLTPGTHLAISMIPVGGATRQHPALFIIEGPHGKRPVAIVSDTTPALGSKAENSAHASSGGIGNGTGTTASGTSSASSAPSIGTTTGSSAGSAAPGSSSTSSGSSSSSTSSGSASSSTSSGSSSSSGSPSSAPYGSPSSAPSQPVSGTAFPLKLPPLKSGETRAVAVGTQGGGVTYDVAYTLVTVKNGAPVTQTNSAYAQADCQACTTVAVSVQIVLIVGQSNVIAPVNQAGAENVDCPACITTALAEQIVVTLKSAPTQQLLSELNADLQKLNALPALGADGTPAAVASEVAAVQQQIESQLAASGQLTNQPANSTSSTTTSGSTASTSTSSTSTTTAASQTSTSPTTQTTASSSTTTATSTETTSTTSSPTTTASTTATSPQTTTTSAAGGPVTTSSTPTSP